MARPDTIVDTVLFGAPAWPLNLEVLNLGGRIVVIGLLGGARTELNLAMLLSKRARVMGTVLRSRSLAEKIDLTSEFAERAGPLLADGRLRAIVDRRFPLERAAEAHAAMESNVNFGKIVLSVGED